MPENNEIMIKKHSGMIQTHVGNMTLTQRKLINFLIYIAQKSGNQNTYKTTISDVKQVCNFTSTENISVKEQLKDLAKTTIEFNYLDKDKYNIWGISTLLASALISPNHGTIEFEFSNLLKGRILNPSMYAPLNIILIAGLKCSYAVVLYEFLRDYLTAPSIPMLTIEDFKNLLGIDEGKYKSFPDFRRKVLNPAVEEINLKTDICCRFELIKEAGIRNRYSHIRFFVSKKTGNLTYEKNEDIKNEGSDLSMDLFEESTNQANKSVGQIPEDILFAVPEKHRTKAVIELISKHLDKGTEYIFFNIKYTIKKATANFSAYLNKALANDYASHDREVETKIKVKTEKIIKHKAEAEKKVISDRIKTEKKLEIIRQLPDKELEKLRKRAITIIKKESPGNEFALSDSLVEMKMADLHVSDHEIEKYSGNDLD